jgi:hypothetical protein
VVTADGERRQVPAGPCWIGPRSRAAPAVVVRWREHGVECDAYLSHDDLTSYLVGCVLQYA